MTPGWLMGWFLKGGGLVASIGPGLCTPEAGEASVNDLLWGGVYPRRVPSPPTGASLVVLPLKERCIIMARLRSMSEAGKCFSKGSVLTGVEMLLKNGLFEG